MANEQQATMQLPMDLIAPAIQAHINSAVIAALSGHEALIEKLVQQIMGQKVDSEGRPNTYSGCQPWLTWAVHSIMRDAIRESIKAHLAKSEEKIKAALEAEMRKSQSKLVRSLVESMAKGMVDTLSSNYRLNITFTQ